MDRRVVVTGMGVVSPIGVGIKAFEEAMKGMKSGISHISELEELGFGCQIGGVPNLELSEDLKYLYANELQGASMMIIYACLAGLQAWRNAGFMVEGRASTFVDIDTGAIIGTGIGASDIFAKIVRQTDLKQTRKLRSTIIEHSMTSGPSANLSKLLGLGNQLLGVSSACASGSDAILMGYQRIRAGFAKRMLVGGAECYSPYGWAGFDAMRVTTRKYNDNPTQGSRPMTGNSSGFVPGSGSGVLVLEDYDSAQSRGAQILCELKGGWSNSGGQRNDGSMTAPTSRGVIACIRKALLESNTNVNEIDYVSGHLSSTFADANEISNISQALGRSGDSFPYINSLKSLIGHCIGATGAIESIAAILQMKGGYIHGTLNLKETHSRIAKVLDTRKAPRDTIVVQGINSVLKLSFAFGDSNVALIFKVLDDE